MPARPPTVILVNPPLTRSRQAGSLSSIANFVLPLGLASIAAVLRRDGYTPVVIDAPPTGATVDDITTMVDDIVARNGLVSRRDEIDSDNGAAAVDGARPLLAVDGAGPLLALGLTATVLSIASATETAAAIKRRHPDLFIVIGGPHATTVPDEVMAAGPFDAVVVGEGEATIIDLLATLQTDNPDFERIKGLAWRRQDDGAVVINESRSPLDLDGLPMPARDLFPPLSNYTPMPLGYRRLPFAHMVVSRGCPYHCVFCDQKVFGHRYRSRSATAVVDEMEELVTKYGVRDIRLYDDLFTARRDHVRAICQGILERKLDLTWSCSTRVDRVDETLVRQMAAAGCWELDFGLETGDATILESINKGTTKEAAEQAVRAAHAAGVQVRAFFVFGFPQETVATIRRTVDWACSLPIDLATFYCLQLYPGSPLHAELEGQGRLLHRNYAAYSSIIDTNEHDFHYLPDGLTADELRREVRRAYHRFYLRPGWAFRRVCSIRSLTHLKGHLSALAAFFSL